MLELSRSLGAKIVAWTVIEVFGLSTSLPALATASQPPAQRSAPISSGLPPTAASSPKTTAVPKSKERPVANAAAQALAVPSAGDVLTVAAPAAVRWLNAPPGRNPDEAWALWDGDPESTLSSPDGAPIELDVRFEKPIWLAQLSGYGRTRGELRVSAVDDEVERPVAGIEQRSLVLSGAFGPLRAATPAPVQHLRLEWTPGDEAGLAELAIWEVTDPARLPAESNFADRVTSEGFPGAWVYPATRDSARIGEVGEPALQVFDVPVANEPRGFSRAFLVYELEGVSHWSGVPRSVNGSDERSTLAFPVAKSDGKAGLQVEEINPAWLVHGDNRVVFAPARASVQFGGISSYRVSALRLVGVPHGASYGSLEAAELLAPVRERTWSLALDELSAPHDVTFRLGVRSNGTLLASDGSGRGRLRIPLAGLEPGWHRWDASSTLGTTSTLKFVLRGERGQAEPLADLRVSGAAVLRDGAPELRISYPLHGECSGESAYVRGFLRHGAHTGTQFSVDGQKAEAKLSRDGSFELAIPGKSSREPWTSSVTAALTDGRSVTQSLRFNPCVTEKALLAQSGTTADTGAPYGAWVLPNEPKTLHYAGATLEVPAGAVESPVFITIRPLTRAQASPPSRGLYDVLPGQGSFRFGPAGLRFAKPVRLTLPYDRTGLPPAATTRSISTFYFDEGVALWRAIPKVADAAAGVLVSESEHFTEFMNATMPAPDAPGPKNSAPDQMKGIELGSPSAGVDLITPPTVNPQRTANLGYPLRLPPGRNGLAPSLSISYSSARANGWLGVGWDLPLSAIEHDTRFGVPDYGGGQIQNDHPGSLAGAVRFTLDGAQLTAVGSAAGGLRYERRIEGSFERILLLPTPGNSSIQYWEVTDKTGVKSIYGKSANSRLADPNDATRVFKWNLEAIEDRFGNRVLFKYFLDQQAMSSVVMPQIYPNKICYGAISAETTADCSGTYNVKFVLDAADTRLDRLIDARAGFPVKTSRRLERVDVFYGTTQIRSYDLRYKNGAFQKTLLDEIGMLGSNDSELYKHHFEYQTVNNSAPFAAPIVWGTRKSSTGTRSEHGLVRTKGFTAGGGGGLGVDFVVVSASVSAGGSFGESRVRTAPAEVTGDGVLDFLTGASGSLGGFPRDNSGGLDHLLYASIPNVGGDSLGFTHTGGWTAGGGVSVFGGVAGIGGSVAHNETEDRNVLADLNGDGFVDQVWVDDGAVKYRAGSKNRFDTVRDFGGYDDSMVVFANADRLQNQKSAFFLADPIARWKAPFAGPIRIAGPITKLALGGDGVTVSIYKNDALLWSRTVAGDDTTSCVPSPANGCDAGNPLQDTVGAGDDLYFRVSSIDDTRKDLVQWLPEVSYLNPPAGHANDRETFGTFVYHSSLAEDFRVVGLPKRPWLPNAPGVVKIYGPSVKQTTPDNVELNVYRAESAALNPATATLVAHLSLAAGFSGAYELGQTGIDIQKNQLLFFELKSDSPVDPARVGWAPIVEYTHYNRPDPETGNYVEGDILGCAPSPDDGTTVVCQMANDPAPDDPLGIDLIRQPPEVNIATFMWEAGAATSSTPASTTIAAGTLAKGTTDAPVCALVQGVNKLFSKACLGPTQSGPVTLPAPAVAVDGEPLYFTLISQSPIILGGALGPNEVSWSPSNGGNTAPINVRRLDPDFADTMSPSPTHDMMSGGFNRWSFGDYRADRTFSEASLTYQAVQASADQAPFFFASGTRLGVPGSNGPAYKTRGQGSFVGAGLFMPSRSKGGRGFSGNGGAQALRQSDTWSYGLDANVFGVSVGIGAADTTGEVELLDMNGDNFPDLVTRNGVLFNTGNGFTAKRGGLNFGEFRQVDQKSMRLKASFSLGGNDEKNQAVPDTDTRGKARAMVSTSFSAGLDYAVSSAKTELLDVNQDGLPDRVEFDPQGQSISVRLNTGYGLTAPIAWNSPAWSIGGFGLRQDVLDKINILGKNTGPNAARFEDTGSLSVGVAVGGSFSVGVFGGGGDVGAGYVYSLNRQAVDFIDLNADGLLDQVGRLPGDDHLRVKLNLGDRFDQEQSFPLPQWPSQVESSFSSLGSKILDAVDGGDGNPEAIGFSSSRDYSATFDAKVCYFFVCASVYGFYTDTAGGSAVAFRDVNGDGLVDQVAKVDGDPNVYVKLNQLGQANLLKSVTRPFGGSFELAYQRYGNELIGEDSTRTVDLPANGYALASVRESDGRGQTLEELYDYRAANAQTGKYDRVEREDYGSSQITLTRGVKGSTGDGSQIETRFFNQDFYRRGLVSQTNEREVAADNSPRPLTRLTLNYEDPTTGTANQVKPDPIVGSFFPAEVQRKTEWFEGQPVAGKSTTETRTWDYTHGGILTLSQGADDGTADDLFYGVEYETRGFAFSASGELYLARPSRVVARQGSASGAILRERRSAYDSATGALATYSARITGGGIPGSSGIYADAPSTLTLTRDSFGNLSSTTDANGYVINYEYDSTGIYQTRSTDSFGYSSSSVPDYLFGAMSIATDLNGHGTRYQRDAFGRVTAVWGPADFIADAASQTAVAPTLRADYGLQPGAANAPFWARMGHKDIVRNDATVSPQLHDYVDTVTFIDGFDRVLQTKKDLERDFGDHTEVGMGVSGQIEFDERGRLKSQGQPIFSHAPPTEFVNVATVDPGSVSRATTWTYDVAGRVVKLSTPADPEDVGQDVALVTTQYGFGPDQTGVTRFQTTVVDAKQRATIQRLDVMNRVLEVVERADGGGGAPIVTRYTFDPVGDLLTVRDARGNLTQASYDTAGRMVSLANPDTGRTDWEFDLVGNLRERQTARLRALGQTIRYDYDYNRLRQVVYPQSVPRAYFYGGPELAGDANGNVAGRVMKETSEAGERDFQYDRFGNESQLDVTFNRMREPQRGPYRYQVQHSYDSFGRLLRTRYPDLRVGTNPDQMALGDASREVVSYGYDAGGKLKNVFGLNTRINEQHPDESPNTVYLAQLGYDEFGQRVHQIAGNFIETQWVYKPRSRRLAELNADERDSVLRQQNRPARPFQRLRYRYDIVGNVTELRNDAPYDEQMNASVLVGNLKHSYQYDPLDRLTQASGVIQERRDWRYRYTEQFNYDDIHNVTKKVNQSFRQVPDGAGGFRDDYPIREQTYDADYTYAGPRPHAPTRIAEQLPAESTRFNRDYDYDASGNQTKWTYRGSSTREIKWNEEDLASQILINGQSLSKNLYDGEGQRAVSLHQVSGLEETAYISQDLTIRDGKYLTKHVYSGSTQLASKMDSAWLNYPPTLYMHTDHLSSTQYSSDSDQNLIQHDEYFPSGELWQNETDSRYELARRYVFTGKELDIGTGLYYYGARYYDGRQSQWLSPDPMLQRYLRSDVGGGIKNPQNLGLYGYAWNNPTKLIDLGGLLPDVPGREADDETILRLTLVPIPILRLVLASPTLRPRDVQDGARSGSLTDFSKHPGTTFLGTVAEALVTHNLENQSKGIFSSISTLVLPQPATAALPAGVAAVVGATMPDLLVTQTGFSGRFLGFRYEQRVVWRNTIGPGTGGLPSSIDHGTKTVVSLWEVTVSSAFPDIESRAAKVAAWARAPGVKAVLALDRGAFYSLSTAQQAAIVNTVTSAGGYIALTRDLKTTAITDARLIAGEVARP